MDGTFINVFVVVEFNSRNVAYNISFYSSGNKSEGELLQKCRTHLHLAHSI